MGLSTALVGAMTPEQVEAYALQLRIEEITQKMKINDVVPPTRERSRSPPPTYDNMGRRTNTREVRYRKKLEDERHRLVEKAMRFIPEFKPPSDYRRLTRTQEKIYIPVNDVPAPQNKSVMNSTNVCSTQRLILVLTSPLTSQTSTALLDWKLTVTLHSWPFNWTPWKHTKTNGSRIRRQNSHPRKG
jgi:Splicing factor 1 helix-hairpin domain